MAGLYMDFGNAGLDVMRASLSFTALGVGTDTLYVKGLLDSFDPFDSYGLFYGNSPFITHNEDLYGSLDITVNPIPEPATMLLLGSGLIGMGAFRRRKLQK